MPFGLQRTAATFQRLMDTVLQPLAHCALVHIDDIVIYSQSWEEHLKHLRPVLDALINWDKSWLGRSRVVYLGLRIGKGKVSILKDKVDVFSMAPHPVTKKALQHFLGLTDDYWWFILQFSSCVVPLMDGLKKKWSPLVQWTSQTEPPRTSGQLFGRTQCCKYPTRLLLPSL